MRFTIDNCVILGAFSESEDNAACRRFLERLTVTHEPVFQPAGFLLELMCTIPRKRRAGDIDGPYLNTLGFTESEPLSMTFVEVTNVDVMGFWTLEPTSVTTDEWEPRLVDVRPAYDLEYAITAWKSQSTLVSTDKKVLALGCEIDVRHPAEVVPT